MRLGKIITDQKTQNYLSVRMPHKMLNDINSVMTTDGISPRKRSAWISGAIVDLGKASNCCDLVLEEWFSSTDSVPVTVSLTTNAVRALETVRKKVEKSDKKKSKNAPIIRTAILQKLIYRT